MAEGMSGNETNIDLMQLHKVYRDQLEYMALEILFTCPTLTLTLPVR